MDFFPHLQIQIELLAIIWFLYMCLCVTVPVLSLFLIFESVLEKLETPPAKQRYLYP